ncbi:MAG: ATP-binding protein, partial [Candidatus Omnitrophica bacterium]|nr:ATP-binding protein [Candidatus Omnitrophota bacterium]
METDPVSREIFFGRGETLSLLEKRFKAFLNGYRHNLGLIGIPHVGKSSILAQFLRSQASGTAISIFIRLQHGDSFSIFSQKWLGGILCGYAEYLKLPAAKTFGSLVNQVRKKLPGLLKKMRRIKKLTKSKRYDESYRELLGLSQVVHEESGRKVLLVIDEFDRLADLPLHDPFTKLGKEIMLQKDTMYIVTSSK